MSVLVLRGDARALPLPDASVDLICTSPPYFALRSYTDGGEHYSGQIGSEPTPAEYIDNLIACTREWIRVLKPTGSLWLNLGDKYGRIGGVDRKPRPMNSGARQRQATRPAAGVTDKSLMGLPWRYALRCIDDLGLILRAEVIWSKPNGLPESVTDRVRRSHEQWFHLVRQPRYFSAVDEIREPHARTYTKRDYETFAERNKRRPEYRIGGHTQVRDDAGPNPLGKLPGSVWEIPTEPLQVPDHLGIDHFAAFPTELPRRIILGWSPSGICTACGEGRRPVTAVEHSVTRRDRSTSWIVGSAHHRGNAEQDRIRPIGASTTITGEACAYPDTSAPTRPAVVVDPFGGTGTTALVAAALGRHGITVDRSADYCRLARWRTSDRSELAKAMRVPKPPKPIDGQEILDLFA